MGGISLLAALEMEGRGGILGARSPLGGWGAGRTGARGVNVWSVIGGRVCGDDPVCVCVCVPCVCVCVCVCVRE